MNTPVAQMAICTFCTRMLVRFSGVKNLSERMLNTRISRPSRMGIEKLEMIWPRDLLSFFSITNSYPLNPEARASTRSCEKSGFSMVPVCSPSWRTTIRSDIPSSSSMSEETMRMDLPCRVSSIISW